jgi:hypothetical protein
MWKMTNIVNIGRYKEAYRKFPTWSVLNESHKNHVRYKNFKPHFTERIFEGKFVFITRKKIFLAQQLFKKLEFFSFLILSFKRKILLEKRWTIILVKKKWLYWSKNNTQNFLKLQI